MNYIIRRIRSYEYEKLCDLIYQTYGDTYVYKYMYDPDTMKQLNDSNRLISFVAVTSDGHIVGHVALKISYNQGEMLAALIKKEYRRQQILHEISYQVIESAKEIGLEAVYVMSIMSHDYSQKAATRLGLSDTAIILSCMDPMSYKGIIEKTARESLKVAYRFMEKPETLSLYIPDELTEMTKLLYNNMQIMVRKKEAVPKGSLEAHSVIKMNYTHGNICFITIEEYGEDLFAIIDPIIRRLNQSKCKSIYLNIYMEDPYTPLYYPQFISRGFFFGGVKPGVTRNRLILQNIEGCDMTKLKVNTLMGKNLLKYILEHREQGLIKEKNYEYL